MEHDKMMRIIHDVFSPALPRLAPGDDASTRRALEMLYGPELAGVGEDFRALDMCCGNGAPTLRLAAELGCRVTAVDNHRPYLDELERRAKAQGLDGRITTRCADMMELDFGNETFDLVWAEGAPYLMGLPEALRAWRTFLKPGGALGFTDLVWFEEGAPDACREFFAATYPQMTDADSHLATIDACGYDLVGRFRLPESSWWDGFYDPLAERLDGYQPPDDDQETRDFVAMIRGEIDIYRRFSRWHGYEFFVMRSRA